MIILQNVASYVSCKTDLEADLEFSKRYELSDLTVPCCLKLFADLSCKTNFVSYGTDSMFLYLYRLRQNKLCTFDINLYNRPSIRFIAVACQNCVVYFGAPGIYPHSNQCIMGIRARVVGHGCFD